MPVFGILIVLLTLMEITSSQAQNVKKTAEQNEESFEFSLTKSLGYTINENLAHIKDMLGNNTLSEEHMQQYMDIMKFSRELELVEKFDDEETRSRRLAGSERLGKNNDKRRSASRFRSEAGQRRMRSLATRREKLKSQGLRNHLQHTKHNLDYQE